MDKSTHHEIPDREKEGIERKGNFINYFIVPWDLWFDIKSDKSDYLASGMFFYTLTLVFLSAMPFVRKCMIVPGPEGGHSDHFICTKSMEQPVLQHRMWVYLCKAEEIKP